MFEREPVASASIAQVHRARLRRKEGDPEWKDDEGWVAVKVRKPNVPIQIEWSVAQSPNAECAGWEESSLTKPRTYRDLFAYRTLLWAAEKAFDIPVSVGSGYVTEQMRKEVDLHNEALNATKTAQLLANEPTLRDRVMVPTIHWEWTGKSIMTAEWVSSINYILVDWV